MKHLNPRQGITTSIFDANTALSSVPSCETPKSPPGDYNGNDRLRREEEERRRGVKHLNPRQGITTQPAGPADAEDGQQRV